MPKKKKKGKAVAEGAAAGEPAENTAPVSGWCLLGDDGEGNDQDRELEGEIKQSIIDARNMFDPDGEGVGTKLPTEPPYSGPKLTYRQQVKLKIEYATVQGQSVSEFKAAAKSGVAEVASSTLNEGLATATAAGAAGPGGPGGSTALSLLPDRSSSQLTVRSDKIRAPTLQPEWHAPWKMMRVISGHLGWVRAVAVDPANQWFATGAGDRTIKIWDMASGTLKLTLTGHISTVRGLAVSATSPYLFSAAEDKTVKCWDLEQNKVVRHYHGHLSGVYCAALHPTLDVLVTGGRDSTARVWDIRTKNQVHVLAGHTNTVVSLGTQDCDPQIVTGSMDNTIRYWDLAKGERTVSLTNHKKSVRALAIHPYEFTHASASADNIKKWKFPRGEFLMNMRGQNAIINAMSVNQENVLVTGGDNGSLHFWDWKTGYNFQKEQIKPQPGSLESEAGVFASTFDVTGTRLITCEADKSIKMWKEDTTATPESHPVNFKPNRKRERF